MSEAVDLGLKLAKLMETDPDNEAVTAARLALEIGYSRANQPFNIEDFAGGKYHRAPEIAEYSELQKRRWPPNGDRDEWVRDGEPVRIPEQRQSEWTPAPQADAGAARVRGR